MRFRVRRSEDCLSVPLQLQVLESEHLDTSADRLLFNGNAVRSGIEFHKLAQREAYYLFREHLGEKTLVSAGESVRIPASEVLHIYKPLRPGQIRGEPWLSRVACSYLSLEKDVKFSNPSDVGGNYEAYSAAYGIASSAKKVFINRTRLVSVALA